MVISCFIAYDIEILDDDSDVEILDNNTNLTDTKDNKIKIDKFVSEECLIQEDIGEEFPRKEFLNNTLSMITKLDGSQLNISMKRTRNESALGTASTKSLNVAEEVLLLEENYEDIIIVGLVQTPPKNIELFYSESLGKRMRNSDQEIW